MCCSLGRDSYKMWNQGDKIACLLSRLLLGTNHGNLNMKLQLQSGTTLQMG